MSSTPMAAQTADSLAAVTPDLALQMLRDGNTRFVEGAPGDRNLHAQVRQTAGRQYPYAVVLACMDSRVPVETVLDQGIGDIFCIRVAGNVVGEDQLASLEFACKVAGARLILVLGHTDCGAVIGALTGSDLGNLTALLDKVGPAAEARARARASGSLEVTPELVAEVSRENVAHSIDVIRTASPTLAAMEVEGAIRIEGAIYEVESGKVNFL